MNPVPPIRSGFPDFGPDPDFFEQTSPDLVRIELLKSGLTIFRAYADDKPYSFGSKHRLYEAYAKDVDNALYKNDTYTSFKQHRCSKSFSPINCNKDLH